MCLRFVISAIAAVLVSAGCVQARVQAYEHPKPPEPCQVVISVEGKPTACVSRAHAQEILDRL